jgi:YidC/Oxa1 family membrane protein insertase
MDKKNTTIGVLLLLAAFAVFIFAPRSTTPTQPHNASSATSTATPATATPTASAPLSTAPAATQPASPAAANGAAEMYATINRDTAGATVTTLANDFIEARLTNHGGAILEVAFKKYPAVLGRPEPYIFNHLHEDPILALGEYPGLDRSARYEVVRATPTEVVYRAVVNGLEVTRRYRLVNAGAATAEDLARYDKNRNGKLDPDEVDPYRVTHETTFRNTGTAPIPLPRVTLGLGTAALLNSSDTGQYLNATSFDGSNPNYIDRGEFTGGGLGSLVGAGREPKSVIEQPGNIVWAAVKNQFFASIYTPDKPGIAMIARPIELTKDAPFADSPTKANVGITAAARFEVPAVAPGASVTLGGVVYVGPREYKRLAQFDRNEDRIMQFDRGVSKYFLGRYVAPLENTLLNLAHAWVGNWGVAVILMTLILKLVSLPFTLTASRSAKRMAKLQPQMQALREKYKDNPQKQQQATMELFKANKVNPLGGCIPVLITMPLFFGFFAMLQGAAELRFAPFLWAKDLAAQDTVGHLFGFPINIMPLLMGATMLVQMRLTPTPSVDNAQATMMKFMPIIFIAFCYTFSCALSLYSTINGLFTIGQQLVINRMRDDPGGPAGAGSAAVATAAAWRKGTKNITPPKKK